MGRWGNFFNREAFGGDSNGLFAMKINVNDPNAVINVPDGVSYIDSAHNFIQVQPTFLYESFFNLCLLIIIMIFRKKKKYYGEVFMWYFLGYGIIRFFIEGMRTDQLIMPGINYPVSQLLSLVLVIVTASILIANRICIKKKGKPAIKIFCPASTL